MERSEKLSFDAKEVTEWEPKLGRKIRSPVTYDGLWEAVILRHHVYDYFP